MVIVHLNGGLGNQLFQYAMGRRFAEVHKEKIKLDLTAFESYNLRSYKLNHFNISSDIASPYEIARMKRKCKSNEAFLSCHFDFFYYLRKCITEKYFHFDPKILNLPNNIYLEGYWQSEKYFKDIEKVIRVEFTVSSKPDRENSELLDKITAVQSISLHIRRGDYVMNPATAQLHGICPLLYYQKAIDLVSNEIEKPEVFVFSDDTEWVTNNLKLKIPMTIVSHNGPDQDYEDLRLMTNCKHHIIANSSFSWWGAWLGTNTDKMIIAPEKWFANPKLNTKDLIPESWIRIS